MATSEVVEQLSPLKEFLLTFYMPEKCYDQFFLHFNFMHVPCLKIVLSKVMGIWTIMGTVMAQLPQIWKVLRAGSAEGLSFVSILLDLCAISSHVAYCITHNFPIGAWGESLFMLIQIVFLGFLIQQYSGRTVRGVCFIAGYCSLMYLLISPLTPGSVIAMMQESSVLAIIVSRLIQAGSNYCSSHTGQLSAVSVFLVFAGSLARIFTSLQDTGQSLSTLTHLLASCCSGLLLAQVLFYWNSCPSSKHKAE